MIFRLLKFSFLCVTLFFSVTVFAQLDNPKSKVEVPIELIQPDIDVEKHNFIDPRVINDSKVQLKIERILKDILAEEERQNLKNKGIMTAEQMRESKFKKHEAEINKRYAVIDQYLGGFSSTSESVTIVCRDFQYPDGDTVTIYVNDVAVVRNIVLTNSYQQFTLPLEEGLNVISFMALNQGTSGPNTAAFMVFDDQAKVISSNEWNLATGAKATLSIARITEE